MNLSLRARSAAANAIVALADLGSARSAGYIEIRSGIIPATPDLPVTGTLLATLSLSNPAFTAGAIGITAANPIGPDSTTVVAGTPTWFRLYDRDGGTVLDGTISDTTLNNGDIKFDNTNFIVGSTIFVNQLTFSVPSTLVC